MTSVGIAAIADYLPERWMSAAEIAAASGIPEDVVIDRFGLKGKHIAGPDEHVSGMSITVARKLLDQAGLDGRDLDGLIYFGSTWKDYPVWQAAPRIAAGIGADRAFVLELDYVSCGTPIALRVARDLMVAEEGLRRVIVVAAARESALLDYANPRSRFMFNFGDGAVAALLERDASSNLVLGSHSITDGAFSLDVKVPAGGSVEPATCATVEAGRHTLDVADPAAMKERLDAVSLPNFVAAARGALERSGLTLGDIDVVCGIHMKRSMHREILGALGVAESRAVYLDDTGHMSGVDPLLGLGRAVRSGLVTDGSVALLLAAGTGYTWAATVVRWGPAATGGA